jgi:tetratricopeptide (TPR) repeat protein
MEVAQQEIERATALAQQGNTEAAVTLLSQLIQRDTSNVAAWLALSNAVDDPERAEYCLQKVLNLDPDNAVALEMLSKTKGGSLSVGSVGGLSHGEAPAGEDVAPVAQSEAPRAAVGDNADRPEPVPEIPQVSSGEPEQQDELRAPEGLTEVPSGEAAEAEESQEDAIQYEAAAPASEIIAEASSTDSVELEGTQDSDAHLEAAAAKDEPAQGSAERSSIGRTDLILIGLTVLAGIVLCALVSATLI